LALVASKNPITECLSEFGGDLATVFDRQVAQAAPGIDAAVGQDSLGWAGTNTKLAFSTAIGFKGKVWFQFKADQQLRKMCP